uniref:Uncharacterized protein n=1 Tax=Kalanchoe fedtschenkoi TaxID=63787 RepID=A0A7N0U864_KALFE
MSWTQNHTHLLTVTCRYRGIGIRVEDEVLITESGYEVLTGSMPKEVKHIESLLNNYSHAGMVSEPHHISAAASS